MMWKEQAIANRVKGAAPTYVTTCVIDAWEPFSKMF